MHTINIQQELGCLKTLTLGALFVPWNHILLRASKIRN